MMNALHAASGCGCRACLDRLSMAEEEHAGLWHLHGLVEEADSAIIGPVDNRTQEVDTQRFPWNTICHLCRVFPANPCSGCSGTLIAPDLVLTAGHCLFTSRRDASIAIPRRTGRSRLRIPGFRAGSSKGLTGRPGTSE
jgi:V8-like Glu-specific endopeptidase